MTRITFARRRHHALVWILLGTGLLLAADVAVWLAYAAWKLAPLLLAGAAAAVAYRRLRGRRILPPQGRGKVLQGRAEPDCTTDLEAERDDLRRQVAKLEDAAAKHDDLLERLERVIRRPVEFHLADLERAQRLYGPAATGKPGRRS